MSVSVPKSGNTWAEPWFKLGPTSEYSAPATFQRALDSLITFRLPKTLLLTGGFYTILKNHAEREGLFALPFLVSIDAVRDSYLTLITSMLPTSQPPGTWELKAIAPT